MQKTRLFAPPKPQHRVLKKPVFSHPGVQETRFFAPQKNMLLLATFQRRGFPCFTQPLTNLRLSDSALELCFSRATKCKNTAKPENVVAHCQQKSSRQLVADDVF